MDPGEIEALIQCLVANPHDTDALARAHEQGEADPQGYAYLLEQVGTRTTDAAYASHWLSEAANIWSVTLGDAHRAARVLMIAVDRDPTQSLAADRLAQLYREKGDAKALVAMLDRRVRLLTPMLASSPDSADSLRGLLATLHEELGKLWSEPPLEQPRKAIDHYKRAIECDPSSAFSIFALREIYKSLGQWDDAVTLYGMEYALERAPERRLLLARDEATTRRMAGDLVGVSQVLRNALDEIRSAGGDDPVLAQELATSFLDRAEAGAPLDERDRAYGAELLAGLAEAFEGEHGLAYAAGALDLVPGHDRAMQLYAYYAAGAPGGANVDALTLRFHAYVEANPNGPLALDGRMHLAASYEALGQIAQALQVLAPMRGHEDVDLRVAALERLESRPPVSAALTPVAGVNQLAGSMGDDDIPEPMDTDEVAEAPPVRPTESPKAVALEAARAAVAKADKAAALERYLEVLRADPVEPEALAWVEDALRSKRDYAKLRDVLWATARATDTHDSAESRKARLREIAGLSESNLKDLDGAVQAWRQILSLDRGDEAARVALTRALEKLQRWDDLANVYEQEASASGDVDVKIQLEKKLAVLHEQKRNDLVAAGDAWSRISTLTPEDDHPIETAAQLFEKAGRLDLAASAIVEHVEGVTAAPARAGLLDRMAELLVQRSKESPSAGLEAAEAYRRAADVVPTAERYASAEKLFASGAAWQFAADAADRIADLTPPDCSAEKAAALVRASGYLADAGDLTTSTKRLEQAHELIPTNDEVADALAARYRERGDQEKLVSFLVVRGDTHADPKVRACAVRDAARLFASAALANEPREKEQWEKLLGLGDDQEALERLAQIAEGTGDLAAAASHLRRLADRLEPGSQKTDVALREAALLARVDGAVGAAIERYATVVRDLDPSSRVALRAIAELETGRGDHAAAAAALEKELALAADAEARRQVSSRLVEAYVAAGDDAGTFTALTRLREADPEDFDALTRLVALAQKLERWEALIDLLGTQIEVEADDAEISALTRRRAALLADKMDKGDDALAALQEVADTGDAPSREAYVELGDRLGWRGIVATKLVEWWFQESPSEARTRALAGAFERFTVVGRDSDAVRVGVEILRGARDASVATQLEALSVKTCDDVGLTAAQEILGQDLSGEPRARELVRQAELRTQAKMPWAEAVQHGETGLGGLSAEDVAPLLVRLEALIPDAGAVVDLYERQVSRARGAEAREKALIRAALVASARRDDKRARAFFDLALTGAPSESTLDALERAAGEAHDPTKVQRILAEAFASAGGGVRDGGRSRATLLGRAAAIAARDLADVDQAFTWLTEALVAHADAPTLDALSALADAVNSPKRVDDVLTHVLTEVFDGPVVRLILGRRAKVRRDVLGDRAGAAADLKKLHDLSPADEAVMAELSLLLTEQGDHRAMVHLYEDQILRSKDQAARAELGRKVAQLWEQELADPREAADAWRRVLRLKPGDEEATQGLDRAKTNMLKKPANGLVPDPTPAAPPTSTSSSLARVTPAAAVVPPPPTSSVPTRSSHTPPPPQALGSTPPAPHAIPSTPDTLETRSATMVSPTAQPSEERPSVEDVDEADLEPEEADLTPPPRPAGDLEPLFAPLDFGEADTTHTSIDVRLPRAAALALESGHAVSHPTPPPSARRVSKPPPLPIQDPALEPPTSPGRRLDMTESTRSASLGSDRPFAMTDQNPVVDFSETAAAAVDSHDGAHRHRVPQEVVSVTDLAQDDDDDEDDDVLVVDEFVADGDDEFEDVVEPSKPPGPIHQ